MSDKIRIAVLGASGYTGADLVRLAANHPDVEIRALTANTHAGKPMSAVFPHFSTLDLPDLTDWESVDWAQIDAVFCGLPHGTTQKITASVLAEQNDIKFIDMSADFRFRNLQTYADWYGHEHYAPHLQPEAVYGLTEFNRDRVRDARLIACPGCYPTAVLIALLPVVSEGLVDASDIVIDAKSGVSGAGRGPKQNTLFCEAGEGLSPYSVACHRHAPEIEQEIGTAIDREVLINFTPHLIPMNRGELCTCYLRLAGSATVTTVRDALKARFAGEYFVQVLDEGTLPATQNVRGSNFVQIGVFADRVPGRVIIFSALDNLVKGSAGQAIQNMNVAFGREETTGLRQMPLFP